MMTPVEAQPVASDKIDDVPKDLGSDDCNCQSPSPQSMPEPPYSRHRQSGTQDQKQNPDLAAERRELPISRWIERPNAIKNCPTPDQRRCSKPRRRCPEEQKYTNRNECGRFCAVEQA